MISYDKKRITGAQLRAARALLRWSAEELAERAKIGVATVRRAEGADGPVVMTAANEDALVRVIEAAGVEFIPENGGGPGARLRNRPEKPTGESNPVTGARTPPAPKKPPQRAPGGRRRG